MRNNLPIISLVFNMFMLLFSSRLSYIKVGKKGFLIQVIFQTKQKRFAPNLTKPHQIKLNLTKPNSITPNRTQPHQTKQFPNKFYQLKLAGYAMHSKTKSHFYADHLLFCSLLTFYKIVSY